MLVLNIKWLILRAASNFPTAYVMNSFADLCFTTYLTNNVDTRDPIGLQKWRKSELEEKGRREGSYLGAAPVPSASTAYTTKDTLLPCFTLVDEGESTGTANVWRLSCQVSTFWRDRDTWFGFISTIHNCAWQQHYYFCNSEAYRIN